MHFARPTRAFTLVACLAVLTPAATLERLSMTDLVQKSTDIVRARVSASSASFRGTPGRGMIYTHYSVQVLERWKGNAASQMDVAVPGGVVQNIQQTFPGAPSLQKDSEYVLFLWTGKSGITQVLGLSQGIMNEKVDASGNTVLWRGASDEPMVDSSGHSVTDSPFVTSLTEFRTTMHNFGLAVVK